MEISLPEVSHDLSINIDGKEYDFVVNAQAVPLFSYYAIILTVDMADKFYRDFGLDEVYLNQIYPVENIESAISNIKALRTNLDWVLEQTYKAFQDAEWTFIAPNKEKEEE
jgi:hypothetical protein